MPNPEGYPSKVALLSYARWHMWPAESAYVMIFGRHDRLTCSIAWYLAGNSARDETKIEVNL